MLPINRIVVIFDSLYLDDGLALLMSLFVKRISERGRTYQFLIALSSISILNRVVLVTCFNRLMNEEKSPDAVVEAGAMIRLGPVFMTALAGILGFLPMMFSSGSGAEVQKPLTTVVVGGIISATLLTLIVLPILYRLFIKFMQPDLNKEAYGA